MDTGHTEELGESYKQIAKCHLNTKAVLKELKLI